MTRCLQSPRQPPSALARARRSAGAGGRCHERPAGRCAGRGCVALESPDDGGLGLHADDAVDLASVLEHEQRGDVAHAEARGRGRAVARSSCDLDAAGQFGGDLIDDRRDHPARPAPRRPHVDEQGSGECRLAGKGGVGHRDGPGGPERRLAASADGLLAARDLFHRQALVARTTGSASGWQRPYSLSPSLGLDDLGARDLALPRRRRSGSKTASASPASTCQTPSAVSASS